MKVVDLLESRRQSWWELEEACERLESPGSRSVSAEEVTRFAAMYRAACADLALADAYQLPPGTVSYLHQLVGRAHNQVYRSRSFDVQAWGRMMLIDLPRKLYRDNSLRVAFCVFWGVFLACMLSAYLSPEFAEQVVGRVELQGTEQSFAQPANTSDINFSSGMMGYYIAHNASIGLQCFAAGLLCGVGGLFITISNAAILGTIFGHMATLPQRLNFFHFVTAHAPFELTAIVLAAGAGMRLGFSLIDTNGWSRGASLRRAAGESVPAVAASVILFCLAALIEGFVSPSSLPYPMKAAVAVISSGMLILYFVVLGLGQDELNATGSNAPRHS